MAREPRYMFLDGYGNERDVTLEFNGLLDRIACLEAEIKRLNGQIKQKPAEKPEEKVVKKSEWNR